MALDFSTLASQPLGAALSNIFLALVTILLTALGRAAVVYLNAHTTSVQRGTLETIARLAVTSAEQLAIANHIDPTAKKSYAEGIVSSELTRIGLTVPPSAIDSAIEAAVYDTFNWTKAPSTSTVPASVPSAG